MKNNQEFNVIIVGGSYAGLSAAMALGCSLKKVLIIDSGMPCNMQTPHSHNFITQDGEKPSAIANRAKGQVLNYDSVKFHNGLAVAGKKTNDGFEISTLKGEMFKATKLIFATGIKDILPEIEGIEDCWGKSIVHCPYCHGYEIRNQKTGIMASGEKVYHLASLVNNLTDDLTVLSSGRLDLDDVQLSKFKKHNIKIIETEISGFEHTNGYIENVLFKDGSKVDLEAVYAAVPFQQHCQIPAELECELNENGFIKVDQFQKTTVEGVFACGDNSSPMRSVANAVATGNIAGAMVNMEISNEQF